MNSVDLSTLQTSVCTSGHQHGANFSTKENARALPREEGLDAAGSVARSIPHQ